VVKVQICKALTGQFSSSMAPNTQIITADALAAMEQQQLSQFKTTELNRPVPYAVDLGNLYVYDPIPLDAKKFG
jgi:hypothetical protein